MGEAFMLFTESFAHTLQRIDEPVVELTSFVTLEWLVVPVKAATESLVKPPVPLSKLKV